MRLPSLFAALVLLVSAAQAMAQGNGDDQLPPLPGLDEPEPMRPLPGSAPAGRNPSNAAHLDTLLLVEGLIAGGFGAGAAYERSLGGIGGLEVEIGYLRGSTDTGWVLDVLSTMAGPRLSLLGTAVNGPSLGFAGGAALAWLDTGTGRFYYVWPQVRADLAMKFSFGPEARGLFLEPRIGYKVALASPKTSGQDLPRYGKGLVAGLRLGISF